MKLSANEEYGLRCLVRIGYAGQGGSLTIPEMSHAEGVSPAYAAKILRVLRKGGFVKAERGKEGGYTPARPPSSHETLTPAPYRRRSATIVICMSRACRTTCWTTVYRKRCHQGGRWERPMKICVMRWARANSVMARGTSAASTMCV